MIIGLTGGTGFLGQHVIHELKAAGHTVRVLVRPNSTRTPPQQALPDSDVTYLLADPGSATSMTEALKGCEVVVHAAAALTGDAATQHTVTVEGTRTLLTALQQVGVRRLVGIGSLSVYDYAALPQGVTLNEDTQLEHHPAERDAYAQSKLAQDRLFMNAAHTANLEVIVLRPGIFYDATGLWPFSLGKGLGARAWLVMGPLTPDTEVPLVHVADVARAVALAVTCDASLSGQAFNIVESPAPTSQRLLDVLCQQSPRPRLLRMPWAVHWALACLAHAFTRKVLKRQTRLPGLLNPAALAARFTRVHYDANRARYKLGWLPEHQALTDLAQRNKH